MERATAWAVAQRNDGQNDDNDPELPSTRIRGRAIPILLLRNILLPPLNPSALSPWKPPHSNENAPRLENARICVDTNAL